MPANTSDEPTDIGIRELRASLSDVVNEAAVRGRVTFVTSRGRRLAAIVPVPDAEGIVEARKNTGTTPAE
ncbi:type II toxin-antitoxin system prevent-host-death family antitoxin [Streptomyces collinus]